MTLLDLLLTKDYPITYEKLSKEYIKNDIDIELNKLLNENNIHKRDFKLSNNKITSVYWTSRIIPFYNPQSIITSPFSEPFSHQIALERLNDSQLQQEKIWLQANLRKINTEYENLTHRAKIKFSEETENELDEICRRWATACQEMIQEIKSILKKKGTELSIQQILKNLSIDPKNVYWNEQEEEFELPK